MSGSNPETAAGPTTDYRYDTGPLAAASATIGRIVAILALRSPGGDVGDVPGAVRRSALSPAYRDALHGEMRLLRAQLYASGLFAEIVNVDLLTDGRE
jgi:hypothetical protein